MTTTHDPLPPPGQRDAPAASAEAEQLVRDFNLTLIRMLQTRLGSYEDAREIAQEAYARLLNLGEGQVISYHRALLFRIAQNLATDLLRRRRHMELPEPEDLAMWPDPANDPERSARARSIVERLPALLARLPAKTAQAFRLVRLQQRSFLEAAEHMGITERMARIHVARALVFCQQELDAMEDDGATR